MMNSIGWTDPVFEQQVFEKFPAAKDIQLFGKSSKESVSVEKIIVLAPQLAIFGINDHGPDAKNKELIDQLNAAGTQIVFIDSAWTHWAIRKSQLSCLAKCWVGKKMLAPSMISTARS